MVATAEVRSLPALASSPRLAAASAIHDMAIWRAAFPRRAAQGT